MRQRPSKSPSTFKRQFSLAANSSAASTSTNQIGKFSIKVNLQQKRKSPQIRQHQHIAQKAEELTTINISTRNGQLKARQSQNKKNGRKFGSHGLTSVDEDKDGEVKRNRRKNDKKLKTKKSSSLFEEQLCSSGQSSEQNLGLQKSKKGPFDDDGFERSDLETLKPGSAL